MSPMHCLPPQIMVRFISWNDGYDWDMVTDWGIPNYAHIDITVSSFDSSQWLITIRDNSRVDRLFCCLTMRGYPWIPIHIEVWIDDIAFSNHLQATIYYRQDFRFIRGNIADSTYEAVFELDNVEYIPDFKFHPVEPFVYILGETYTGSI